MSDDPIKKAEKREIQKAAVHSTLTTTEGYLDQYRDRLNDMRMPLPKRPKVRKT